jgi:hypothetical protein
LRSTTFVNPEVIEQLEKIPVKDNKKELFPEHEFVASCLRIGLALQDLKILTYVDVMKILLSFIDIKENKATQQDINRLLG